MPDNNWTKPQRDAIESRGGTLLVSAAAGSGKTSVLVERAAGLICDAENPVDADRLLIVTFSVAAAAEIRQRISARLSSIAAQKPEDYGLLRQQALLQKAQISTVHAFCLSLARENFHELPISPDFSVADTGELETMRFECAARVIERFYEQANPAFFELVEMVSNGRDDGGLTRTILKIYDFSRSHPFYENWLDEKAAMYENSSPISETIWGKSILEYASESLALCRDIAQSSLEALYSADEKLRDAYLPAFLSDMRQLEDCLEFAHESDWNGLNACLGDFVFERLSAARGDNPMKERLKSSREKVKKAVQELAAKYLCATLEQASSDIADLAPKVNALFSLVKEFGRELDATKAEKRRVDFSDLEHFALSLLVKKNELGYEPTSRAREISDMYDHIMVDEYQDTNEVQDLIFTSVSRRRENLFMVGDVKQSIYSFRQAMPEIFMAKKAAFFRFDGLSYPSAINLDTNFRSRAEVTGAVNFIFGRIMSARVGEVDYDEDESLKPGAEYPHADGDMRPELLIVDTSVYDGEAGADALEARAIAEKIRSMLDDGFIVTDKGVARNALPGDFCVLLRSPKNRSDAYVRALTEMGIPAWSENAGGFLAAREVNMMLSLLKALDNPLLDIELVAALLSPIFDFTDDDIARIRLKNRSGSFYTALLASAKDGDGKSASFIKLFGELRRGADSLPADRLILRAYEKTGALDIVRAMPSGESRRANLLLLAEYAANYHAAGYKKLGGFIGFVSRLEERGGDLGPANTAGGANSVRIMSVHKSKGLEFPVVILADTSRRFNREELRSGALLHSKYGFACPARDLTAMKQYPTVPMQAIRLESRRSQLSEEMRILYVALTRAREKLIITAAIKSGLMRVLSPLDSGLYNGRLPAYLTGDASSCADWILMSLLRHKCAGELRRSAGLDDTFLIDDDNPWTIRIKNEFPETKAVRRIAGGDRANPDYSIIEALKERAAFVYPYSAQTKTPVKLAVSTAARGERDMSRRFSARPSFLMGESLTAAERGNAAHKFMQFADYRAARDNLTAEIARMRDKSYLSAAETDSLSRDSLRDFFTSPLADRIFSSPKVWRELRFMAEFGKDELGGYIDGMDNESLVVLQGVADCVFIEDGEAVIVDYKTDRVKTSSELIERYGDQLALYKRILSQSLGTPVKECVIYSFALSEIIAVPLNVHRL